ncbi:MAG: hypothetical protein L0Y72_11935 [Gemmataceae bacterium]|nr:hypothetical protein [Gemmataceae bacterium]MCI0739746.1 hypothetical protein [Gemmataceae bacterium]
MSTHEDLSVRYHQQEGSFLCGGACAQMVLTHLGAGALNQADLDDDIHNHNLLESGWAAAPDGLHWTLNNWRPASFPGSYSRFELGSEDAISRTIVWSIHQHKASAVALISGSSHWIVVRGFTTSAPPTSSNDTAYTIESLDINNPAPPASSPPPPPHAASDECGTGGDYGLAEENISYSHWKSAYMTGVPSGYYWGGKYVALCDADPAPTTPGEVAAASKKRSGERILLPELARELAEAGLREFGLYERETWKRSLHRTKPADPILVQRLGKRDTFYYIVPMAVSRKVIPVLVCLDARFGDYQQAARISDRGGSAFRNLNFDPKALLERFVGQSIDLGKKGRLKIRKEAFSLYPTLVWRPCRESMSPYIPFFMLTVGDRRVYVRVDGQVFTSLHINDRGI